MTLTSGNNLMTGDALTEDRFLNGALSVLQPAKGYRAGVDAVLLAAAVPALPGENVLELGCGVGVASLCLARRVSGLHLHGVELQSLYADLAGKNAVKNDIDMTVHRADLRQLPAEVRQQSFDHVIANPPYYRRESGTAAPDPGRDTALAGDTPLSDWIEIAAKRLKPKGYFTLIQDIRRLPEVLSAVEKHLGSLRVLPLSARADRAPHTFLLQARKSGRAEFIHHFPKVMHLGPAHTDDREHYVEEFQNILRHGAALEI